MVGLDVSVNAHGERIVIAEGLVEAAGAFADLGVVGLDDCAVVTVFGEVIAATEDAAVRAELVADGGVEGRIFDVGFLIDGTAIGNGHDIESVGAKHFGGRRVIPLSDAAAGPERKVGRALVAERSVERKGGRFGLAHEGLDDAAHGIASVKIGSAAARDFDGGDGGAGNTIPIDPASEGIDERDAVGEQEGAAGGRTSEAAQGKALRGGIGAAAIGAAKQREAGHIAQNVVEADGGRGRDIGGGEKDGAAGRIG